MKVCLIPPDNHLEMFADMDFILVQRYNNDVYRHFYEQSLRYKIMDNGAYESPDGLPADSETLIRVGEELQVNELIVPDVIRDYRRTLDVMREFFETTTKSERNGFKLMAVPQAETPMGWAACYHEILNMFPEVKVIGIPIWLEKFFRMRVQTVSYLIKRGTFSTNHEHHLLGLDYYGELWGYPRGFIRSVDTSLPFSLGIDELYEDADLQGNLKPIREHPRVPIEIVFNDRQKTRVVGEIERLRSIARSI